MLNFLLFKKLLRRGISYGTVGFGTFLLDLCIITALITWSPIPYPVAVALGFFIAVSINYYISYHWVYAGTTQTFYHGYSFFFILATVGLLVITLGTTILVEFFYIPLFIARTLVGLTVGIMNFILNTFFNFKLL